MLKAMISLKRKSTDAYERGNGIGFGVSQQQGEMPSEHILPRSPLAAVVGLAALLLVARALFRAR